MQKIYPPILFTICILMMVGLWWFFPIIQFITFPNSLVGIFPFFAGLFISKAGFDLFKRKGTNLNAFLEPNILITDGLFKISRNPMYLGFVISLLGFFIILGTLSPFIVVIGFFVIVDRWYIRLEEIAMLKVFGDDYRKYKVNTRRWL